MNLNKAIYLIAGLLQPTFSVASSAKAEQIVIRPLNTLEKAEFLMEESRLN